MSEVGCYSFDPFFLVHQVFLLSTDSSHTSVIICFMTTAILFVTLNSKHRNSVEIVFMISLKKKTVILDAKPSSWSCFPIF